MGQRTNRFVNARPDSELQLEMSIFPTNLGWFGILGMGERVSQVTIGHRSAADARAALRSSDAAAEQSGPAKCDWHPQLREGLTRFAAGMHVEFDEIELALPEVTAFRRDVLRRTRQLRYGETVSYGELAARAGHPGAARAVGSTMASNRFPILIPCHRVLAAGGKIGGYSAPQGLDLKQTLLQMEAEVLRAHSE